MNAFSPLPARILILGLWLVAPTLGCDSTNQDDKGKTAEPVVIETCQIERR